MKNSIGKTIVFFIILVSSVLTLMFTLIQLSFEYKHNIDHLNRELSDLEKSFAPSLNNAIWFLNANQIEKILEGISNLPNIAAVKLYTQDLNNFSIDKKLKINGPNTKFLLNHNGRTLGYIQIFTTKSLIYKHLFQKFLWILLTNFIKTSLVIFFAITIFNRLLSRPLQKLAEESAKITVEPNFQRNSSLNDVNISQLNEIQFLSMAFADLKHYFLKSFESIKNSETRFKDIASINITTLFETDRQFNLTLLHHAAHEFSVKKILQNGTSLFELPLAADIKLKIQNYESMIETTIYFENFYYSLNLKSITPGPDFPLNSPNNEQCFLGYRGTLIDITEKTKLEHELAVQKEHLVQLQKIESIGLMTASISHDLNNLLSVMSASIHLLKKSNLNEEAKELCLNNASDAINKSALTLRRLMDFSRKDHLTPVKLNLSKEIQSLENIIKLSVGQSISMVYHLEEVSDTLLDRNQLENMVINLLINAKDAMKDVGEIQITVKNKTVLEDHKNVPKGNYILLSIVDNGPGIDPDIQDKIFEPFFTTKSLGKGTGLGLSMVMSFVKNSKGHLLLISKLGEGTEFQFYFSPA